MKDIDLHAQGNKIFVQTENKAILKSINIRVISTFPLPLKNPTKCLWRWEPDRRSNFFFSPPAHLCAVTYMTEISLIVTLNNKFTHSLTVAMETKTIFFSWIHKI